MKITYDRERETVQGGDVFLISQEDEEPFYYRLCEVPDDKMLLISSYGTFYNSDSVEGEVEHISSGRIEMIIS